MLEHQQCVRTHFKALSVISNKRKATLKLVNLYDNYVDQRVFVHNAHEEENDARLLLSRQRVLQLRSAPSVVKQSQVADGGVKKVKLIKRKCICNHPQHNGMHETFYSRLSVNPGKRNSLLLHLGLTDDFANVTNAFVHNSHNVFGAEPQMLVQAAIDDPMQARTRLCCCSSKHCSEDLDDKKGPGYFRIRTALEKKCILRIIHPQISTVSRQKYLRLKYLNVNRRHWAIEDMVIAEDKVTGNKTLRRRHGAMPHARLVSNKVTVVSVLDRGLIAAKHDTAVVTGDERRIEQHNNALIRQFLRSKNVDADDATIQDFKNVVAMMNVNTVDDLVPMQVAKESTERHIYFDDGQRHEYLDRLRNDPEFTMEQTGEKSFKQLELLYELLNIGGCLEALITVDAPLPDPCDIEDEKLKSAANRASTAAEATHISPMNADKPEGDAPKKPRKRKKLEHQGDAGMPVADINVEPIRREGGTLHPFVEFIIFLVMFRSVGRNPADKSRFSLNFGVHAKTIDRITDKFFLALSFIARHYFPFPSYEEIRQSTTTALAECQRGNFGCSAVIVGDCTEKFTLRPGTTTEYNLLWSTYKHHHTVKIIVVVAGNGYIMHISVWAPGSDDALLRECGLIDELKNIMTEGDLLTFMYDKGLEETTAFNKANIWVSTPPKASNHQKIFTHESGDLSQQIGSARICVEHKNANLWEYDMVEDETTLQRIDMVGHEVRVASLLCNLHQCHSDSSQRSHHA